MKKSEIPESWIEEIERSRVSCNDREEHLTDMMSTINDHVREMYEESWKDPGSTHFDPHLRHVEQMRHTFSDRYVEEMRREKMKHIKKQFEDNDQSSDTVDEIKVKQIERDIERLEHLIELQEKWVKGMLLSMFSGLAITLITFFLLIGGV